MNLASVFRQVFEFWQNPPLTELPEETFIACANRSLTQHLLDLDLTAEAAFTTEISKPFQFGSAMAREKDISGIVPDISRVRRVESRFATSTSEDDWEEETITSHDNWNDVAERSDENFVSFYGIPPALTMVVARNVEFLVFRVVYRQLREKIDSLAEELEIPDIYEPLLVYEIALELAELIDNMSPEFAAKKATKVPYLFQRRQDAYDRIEKWRRSQRGSSVTARRAFNDRRLDSGYDRGRRRFTLHY